LRRNDVGLRQDAVKRQRLPVNVPPDDADRYRLDAGLLQDGIN
jgi:hypothetical protein